MSSEFGALPPDHAPQSDDSFLQKALRRLLPGRAAGVRASQVEARDRFSDEPPPEFDAMQFDPTMLPTYLGFVDRRTAITYDSMRYIRAKLPFISAIISRYVDDLAVYCAPNRPFGEPGFRIGLRDTRREPSRTELKVIQQAQDWMLTSGTTRDGDRTIRPGLMDVVKMLTDNSMHYDQCNLEILHDRLGRPAAWVVVDPTTIRYALPQSVSFRNEAADYNAVQIVNGNIVAKFNKNNLIWGVRNPSSHVNTYGYGVSEIEMCFEVIGHLINGMEYNGKQFTNGVLSPGILNLSGRLTPGQLTNIRKMIVQLLVGVQNAWRLPVTNTEKIEYIDLKRSNKDMEYSDWMNFLLRILLAEYRMDGLELNFMFSGSGSGEKSMFEGPNKAKFTESKRRRIFPVLAMLERMFNEHIIWKIMPDFEFKWTGASIMSPEEQINILTQQLRTFMTVDEGRAFFDLKPLPDGIGSIPDSAVMAERYREVNLAQMQRLLLEQTGNIDGVSNDVQARPSETNVMSETAQQTREKVVIPKVMEPHDEASRILPGMDKVTVDPSKMKEVLGYDGAGGGGGDTSVLASKATLTKSFLNGEDE